MILNAGNILLIGLMARQQRILQKHKYIYLSVLLLEKLVSVSEFPLYFSSWE